MNYNDTYQNWLNDNFCDENTRAELAALNDEKEIQDRFYRDLEFGKAENEELAEKKLVEYQIKVKESLGL